MKKSREHIDARRYKELSEILKEPSSHLIDIDSFASLLGVSTLTVKFDFDSFIEWGVVVKKQGKYFTNFTNPSFYLDSTPFSNILVRAKIFSEEKQGIAKYVVDNILKPDETIFLNWGSTIYELMQMIDHSNLPSLNVYTPSPINICCKSFLKDSIYFNFNLAPGKFDVSNSIYGCITGTDTVEYIQKLKFQKGFTSVDRIDVMEGDDSLELRMYSTLHEPITSVDRAVFESGLCREDVYTKLYVLITLNKLSHLKIKNPNKYSIREMYKIATIKIGKNSEKEEISVMSPDYSDNKPLESQPNNEIHFITTKPDPLKNEQAHLTLKAIVDKNYSWFNKHVTVLDLETGEKIQGYAP